jgi:hypothetical protein
MSTLTHRSGIATRLHIMRVRKCARETRTAYMTHHADQGPGQCSPPSSAHGRCNGTAGQRPRITPSARRHDRRGHLAVIHLVVFVALAARDGQQSFGRESRRTRRESVGGARLMPRNKKCRRGGKGRGGAFAGGCPPTLLTIPPGPRRVKHQRSATPGERKATSGRRGERSERPRAPLCV